MQLIRVLLLLLLTSAACATRADDPAFQTVSSSDLHCSMTIPSTWTATPSNGVLKIARPGGANLMILARPAAGLTADNPGLQSALKQQITSTGHDIVSEETAPFHGFTAYKMAARTKDEVPVYIYMICFAANGSFYEIVLGEARENPKDDPEMKAVLKSFSLTSAPAATATP